MAGILEKRDGRFMLTDRTASVTAELQGAGLAKEVGRCVEVTGALIPSAQPVSPATQVIRVSQVKRCSKEIAAAVAGGAAAAGAGTAVGAGAAAAGMAVATKAIIVGVVVAGAAAGTAVAVTAGGEEPKPLSP